MPKIRLQIITTHATQRNKTKIIVLGLTDRQTRTTTALFV